MEVIFNFFSALSTTTVLRTLMQFSRHWPSCSPTLIPVWIPFCTRSWVEISGKEWGNCYSAPWRRIAPIHPLSNESSSRWVNRKCNEKNWQIRCFRWQKLRRAFVSWTVEFWSINFHCSLSHVRWYGSVEFNAHAFWFSSTHSWLVLN